MLEEDFVPSRQRRKPPPPKKGKRDKPYARHWLVSADLGDGQVRRCWFEVDGEWVVVRGYRRHGRGWMLPLREAAEAIARRAQRAAAEKALKWAGAKAEVIG